MTALTFSRFPRSRVHDLFHSGDRFVLRKDAELSPIFFLFLLFLKRDKRSGTRAPQQGCVNYSYAEEFSDSRYTLIECYLVVNTTGTSPVTLPRFFFYNKVGPRRRRSDRHGTWTKSNNLCRIVFNFVLRRTMSNNAHAHYRGPFNFLGWIVYKVSITHGHFFFRVGLIDIETWSSHLHPDHSFHFFLFLSHIYPRFLSSDSSSLMCWPYRWALNHC